MADDTFQLLPRVGPCPACGNVLRMVSDGELVNLLCPRCGSCWHDELGWIHRVDPATCTGCALRGVCRFADRPFGRGLTG